MARTKKKRNARATDLALNRKKAGNVKGGTPAKRASFEGKLKDIESQERLDNFEIQS